ncbi:DUF1824 family protein [Pantanalinema rosaneae]|uniref:DUF1824 family protein n=1 Tax=Pantanalinema rosaneae TaxID=1620701 RepID=UPI003D700F13
MLAEAQSVLRRFTCLDRLAPEMIPDRALTRQALLLVAHHSDYQIFGICADSVEQATTALHRYLAGLGYEESPTVPPLAGIVYVKYNPKTGRCHTDAYIGQHRGVLVSCQSAYDGDVNETFGHLPLDLF